MNVLDVKKARKTLRLTQQVFADYLNVSKSLVQKWESGDRVPDNVLVGKIELALKKHTEGTLIDDLNLIRSNAESNSSLEIYKEGVPYFDIDFSGGWNSGELFTTQKPSLYISNPEFFSCDFACNLSGQSISNSIPAGAIVGFKEIQDWKTYFSGGEFYGVVTKNDLRTVKIVKKIKGNKEALLLVPDPSLEYKDRFEEEEIPIDFIIGFYQVVAWAQFERLVM